MQRRMVRCVDQIYNVRALFSASGTVEMNEWKAYFDAMSLRHNELGIRSVVYLQRVTPTNLAEFLAARSVAMKTNFIIVPPGNRPVYFPMVYITHFDPAAQYIYGLDHAAVPDRLQTIEQAIDNDAPLMTPRVYFMDRSGRFRSTSGFMIYLPVYKNGMTVTNTTQRREALAGMVSATIVPQVMLTTLFEEMRQRNPGVDVEVFEGTTARPESLIFDDDKVIHTFDPNFHPTFSRQVVEPVLNRSWTFSFLTTPAFDATSPRYLQWLTLTSGLAVSILLFGITWMQAKARATVEDGEAAMAIEKEELAVTLFSIGDGVITTDTKTKIVLINKAAQALTGWTQKEVHGKLLAEIFRLVHEHDRTPAINPVEQVLQTGEIAELDNHVLLVARDGKERAIADSAAPIRDRSGKVTGAVLVFRDVTEKQKLEAQMAKESRLESIGVLAGGIAHDFNNMLTAITANISLARMQGTLPEERMQLLADAEKAAFRARDLTQQLLTFARGGEPVKKLMHLNALVRETCEFALRGSNVQCHFSFADNLWPVEIDEGQFRQVLNNLVINARQAMPDGGKIDVHLQNIELTKDALPSLSGGNYIEISIADSGCGIKPEFLSKIFEPYFTTKKGGSGLGLATAYSVIRKHNGVIKVDSTPGSGSTFQVFLPASGKRLASLPPKSPLEKKLSGRGKILVMDDEISVLRIISAMLQKFGYEVETALDGGEAFERYAAAKSGGNAFDLVIMDLTIPNGMGGREAIKKLRELDPTVKAIVSSGYSFDPIVANFREHGFLGTIPKPYRPEDLGEILDKILGQDVEA